MMYRVTMKRTFIEYGTIEVDAECEEDAEEEAKDNPDVEWDNGTLEEETVDSVEEIE